MPGLVHKLLISAGAQGLLLQSVNQRNQSSGSSTISIEYETNTISSSSPEEKHDDEANEQLEAHGIIGLLNLATTSYLISISRREQVAQIRGKPIYVVTDVALIPISSQVEAEKAIAAAKRTLKQTQSTVASDNDSDDGHDDRTATIAEEEEHEDSPMTPPHPTVPDEDQNSSPLKKGTTVIADVIKDRGKYGRFAEKWFSKGGWSANGRRKQGMSSEEDLTREQKRQGLEALPEDDKTSDSASAVEPAKEAEPESSDKVKSREEQKTSTTPSESVLQSLSPKILRTTKLFFSSRNFYFSYDYDISRSLSRQETSTSGVPMFKRFDPLFFWNRSLISPFVEAGQHGFVLPLLQGFIGQRAFTIGKSVKDGNAKIVDATEKADEVVKVQEPKGSSDDAKDEPHPKSESGPQLNDAEDESFLLTLVSRRSTKRAGLRYLRRGVDDEGNVANSVETEQILSRSTWDPAQKAFSYVQIRGSIPLFFSQSPYSFKPIPITYGSESTNHAAFNKHFSNILDRYGDVQVTSLVDKHGTEVKIGRSYEHHAQLTNSGEQALSGGKTIGFEWFDFHSECRGMKFENVSLLLDKLKPSMTSSSWTETQDNRITTAQSGVLRTNCMDCLDRTNVVQSATAGYTLEQQLESLGLSIDLHADPKTSWFNTLWADNGDACSKQYAGTSALKGDFTRTRKRAWTGALSDFSLTLNRYYNNIFGDYFLQTCVDYWLGNVGASVFEEFETDMMTADYAPDMRRVRQSAIETCVKIVLGVSDDDKAVKEKGAGDQEDMIAGFTLSCPAQGNTLRSLPFEECVLLLTEQALYACRFDWSTEKVGSFERVELTDVAELWRGTYITSTLGPTHMDESKNVGLVVRYKAFEGEAIVRTNTRTMGNEVVVESEGGEGTGDEVKEKREASGDTSGKKDAGKGDGKSTADSDDQTRILAFKALPPRASASSKRKEQGDDEEMSEEELVRHVCEEIQRLARKAVARQDGDGAAEHGQGLEVVEKDIIGVAEAKKSTGYLESVAYSLKKLVWA